MSEPSKEAMEIADRPNDTHPNRRVQARHIDSLREKDRSEDKARIEGLESINRADKLTMRTLCDHITALEEERDKLKAENERLRQVLSENEWLEFHCCITGDCPHVSVQDCVDDLEQEITRACGEMRQALTQSPDTKDQWPKERRMFAEDEA